MMLEGSFGEVNLMYFFSWWSHHMPARCPHLENKKLCLVLQYAIYVLPAGQGK